MDVNRKEEIWNAFLKLADCKGLDNTTMQDVANEVGISVGTIYLDFKNKNDLIDAFHEHFYQQIQQFRVKIYETLEERGSVEQLLHEVIIGELAMVDQLVRKNRGFFDYFSRDYMKYTKQNLKKKRFELLQQKTECYEKVLAKGVQTGVFEVDDISQTAALLIRAFNEYFSPMAMERDHETIIAEAEQMFQLILKGVQKSKAG